MAEDEDVTEKNFEPDWNDVLDDPEMGDENDPDYMEEIFEGYQALGWTPDMLKDKKHSREYADWLKKQSSGPD